MIFGICADHVLIDIVDHVRNLIDIECFVGEFAIWERRDSVVMAMVGSRHRCSKTSNTQEKEEVKGEEGIHKGEHDFKGV